jgi:D-glucosaminate-6-phosphate ammonia-lyase
MILSNVINVSGTMTGLGASVTSEPVIDATANMMRRFVKIHELQSLASEIICDMTGAELGFVSASASAAISMSIAGAMTGLNATAVEQLPNYLGKEQGKRLKVAVQAGHLCNYGAPIAQAIELTGAQIHSVGSATLCTDYQLQDSLSQDSISHTTVAALYVISHHASHYGQIPLARFCQICKAAGVPVIVDAASEYELEQFLKDGADIVIYSGHKFLGGPTSGIVAGNKALVRAAYLQNIGLCRAMKVGKESIAGCIAALQQWRERDHLGIKAKEEATLSYWQQQLSSLVGISTILENDPTGNPLRRITIHVDSVEVGLTAAGFAEALAALKTPIIVRDHEVEHGWFQLDPCNLLGLEQQQEVAQKIVELHAMAKNTEPSQEAEHNARNANANGYLSWME